MTVIHELTKNIGNIIDIKLCDNNNIKGIITRIIKPNFFEIDFCMYRYKIQHINIDHMLIYSIIDDKKEIKKLKNKFE